MATITFTLIQTNLHWEDKQANLDMLEKKIKSIEAKNSIVVLPEMFSTGFSMRPEIFAETMKGTSLQWMKRIASSQKIILTGTLMIEEDGKYFNRLIWMQPDGNFSYYDKRHLFAYGDEDNHYTPGNKRLIAQVNGFKINLNVCYDLRFPVWARQYKSDLYDVLLYTANWPERRIEAWKTLLRARAIENQCYVIGVNRVGNDGNNIYHTGESMLVDAMGEILYHKKDEEDIFSVTLEKAHLDEIRNKLPFWKDADDFLITK